MMLDPDPDKPDEFTAHLRAQPPAELPTHWRAEILAVAVAVRPSRGRRVAAAFGEWLWPHPLAYAALTAAWAVILALRLLTVTPRPISSPQDPALAAIGAGTVPEEGAPLFASARLASRECDRDPATEARP